MELPVIFNNRYQLIRKIGEGGLAEVYQAEDMSLGRMVAVKALRPQYTRDPNFLVNFHREAQSAARLNDSYIVAVYDFGQDHERPYIVMEWIAGSDLRTAITERGKIHIDEAVTYTIQVCQAVGTAHRAGLVHGDLKPGNIMLTPNNVAKVTDFGLARALGESAMDEGEVVWGTPAYFAPEQAAGDRVLPATDVYAVGIILYEMLTGRVPFVGVDDQDVARKQLYEPHIPIDKLDKSIPEPLARIVDAAMAKNPNERFLTADHLREALIMYQQGSLGPNGSMAPISAVVGSPLQAAGYTPPPPPSWTPAAQPASSSRRQSGGGTFDLIVLVMGLVAIIAVAGLIPLSVAVYNTFLADGTVFNGGDANVLPTLRPGQVRMPELVGEDESRARAALADMGLGLVVESEEPHPTYPAFTIIRQSIEPGAAVSRGESVNVVLSQGPVLVDLPDVRGIAFEAAEQQLTLLDLTVQRYEDWSPETPGTVIAQEPPPGAPVSNRSLVTLIVSSGARVPIGANLGGQLLLSAYEIRRMQYAPGETIELTFLWQAVQPPIADYTLSIRLTTQQGGIVSQIEGVQPQGGTRPTSQWTIGETIIDSYSLLIPPNTPPGDYQLRVVFQDPNAQTRLPIVETGRAEQDNLGNLILRSVQVIPQ